MGRFVTSFYPYGRLGYMRPALFIEMTMWKPITKERFFEIASTYGLNRQAASDIWFCQPVDHSGDSEEHIIGNFELLATPEWIKGMNEAAAALERHLYQSGAYGVGRFCRVCNRRKHTPIHNLDIEAPAAIATPTTRRLT